MKRIENNRTCLNCNSNTTYTNEKGWTWWYRHEEGYLCKSCYMRLVNNPKWQKIHSKIYSPKRITFRHKRIRLKENPRKGICVKCGKSIGDEFINRFGESSLVKQTHMHHIEYHEDDPLKDTNEVCNSCHSKITRKEQLIRSKDAYQRKLQRKEEFQKK